MPPPRHRRSPGVLSLLALLAALAAPSEARAELCDREGYIRHGADCPNAERDFTGCCPGPALQAQARAERAAAARARAEAARAREAAVRDRAAAEREAARPCPHGTARTSPGQRCCHPGQRADGLFCRCPAGWALREREGHPGAPRACLPQGRYGSGMILFDERGQARDWPDDRPGLLVDRQPVSREEHSLCVRRGGCPPGNREEQGGAIQLGRAEAAVYCAFVGKRLPTDREWALVSPSVDSETPTWTQATARRADERRAVRCAAEPERLVDESLRERLGLVAAPSVLAVRLHAAARQGHEESEPRIAAVNYRALGRELGGQLGGHAFRWAAEAHRNAGQRRLAREAYALYLDARDGLDADARTNALARALGFGESGPSAGSSPAPLSEAVRRNARGLQEGWREHFRAGQQALFAGRHADAQRAFERAYIDVDEHPRRALTKVWLARALEAGGDVATARSRYFAAAQLAPIGDPVGDYARARLRRMGSRLGVGANHACAILIDGRVGCWGDNDEGQLGNGNQSGGDAPTLVQELRDAVAIAVGDDHTCVLTAEGEVSCWGRNTAGQLGDASLAGQRRAPTSVPGLVDMVAISASGDHTCALGADARVHCWGSLQFGSRGARALGPPTPVPGLANTVAIAAGGDHACALGTDGQLRCWGRALVGPITGERGFVRAGTTALVFELVDTVDITAGGRHTCALGADAQVRCWGDTSLFQLGPDMRTPSNTPVLVPRLGRTQGIAAGTGHTCSLSTDAQVECWGASSQPRVRLREPRSTSSPRRVLGGMVAIAAGPWRTCALGGDGQVHCWGTDVGIRPTSIALGR